VLALDRRGRVSVLPLSTPVSLLAIVARRKPPALWTQGLDRHVWDWRSECDDERG
jgi:hypothetical protein